MKRKLTTTSWIILATIGVFAGICGPALAAEPVMSDYNALPIFTEQSSATPNILIMMDNSGSMNTWAYEGQAYNCSPQWAQVGTSTDDAEESTSAHSVSTNSTVLDLGQTIAGVRFKNIRIPRGAAITNAYLQFKANGNKAGASLTIKAHANDNPGTFSTSNYNISNRATTTASVSWNTGAWTTGTSYNSTAVTAIVSEIVNRQGWNPGNNIAFILTGSGEADAYSYDGGAANAPKLYIEWSSDCSTYYGYFSPYHKYRYDSNIFVIDDAAGTWSGNFLNFLTMKRIDVVRKVMTGGSALSTQGTGAMQLQGESVSGYQHLYNITNASAQGLAPYSGDNWYGVENGTIYVDTDNSPWNTANTNKFNIRVQKDPVLEPEDVYDSDGDGIGDRIGGVMQKVGGKARWGNMWFNSDGYTTGVNDKDNGGSVQHAIGHSPFATMIADMANQDCDTWTPLGESYYVAMQHFRAQAADTTLRFPNGCAKEGFDPYDNSETCAKNFVLLLTDGESTKDGWVPTYLEDYADDTDIFLTPEDSSGYSDDSNRTGFATGGTDFLKDVALYARANDLRADKAGIQNILLYPVYAAFGSGVDNARNLLMEAARNGGFTDRNNNNRPDGSTTSPAADRTEWDEDGDGIPDNYYEADDGYLLQNEILRAITDILKRASSGTAASVLATNEEGEGNMTQAYFKPSVTSGGREITWTGYMHSLWIDPCGNLREDSNHDHKLSLDSTDKIIEFFYDSLVSETRVKRFTAHPRYTNHYDCENVGVAGDYAYEEIELDEVNSLFEAGNNLVEMPAADRQIFTFIDKDGDKTVAADADHFDTSGEVVRFAASTAVASLGTIPNSDAAYYLKPYLGVRDGAAYSYLGGSHDARVINLINYIRGIDIAGCRTRTMLINQEDKVWKLGDIVHSTPVTVAKPVENFHLIYKDSSYQTYYDAFRDRETVIYVGANDGMLHAFTSWIYDGDTGEYVKPAAAPASENIGDEIWAYIPQSLLPHLKWLASPAYSHTYYVDLKPKIFEAKILPDDTHYPDADLASELNHDNWGTFMLLGLGMGGKHIWCENEDFAYDGSANDTRHFYPTYTLIDITDPRNPTLIWERTYDNIGFTNAMPAIVKVDESWYAVFGSGPTEYSGWSNQAGRIFVVDLKTGQPYNSAGLVTTAAANDWLFQTAETEAFFGAPVALDKNLNYSVDSAYFGETYDANTNNTTDNSGRASWKGKIYRVGIPCSPCEWGAGVLPADVDYNEDPTTWVLSTLFTGDQPISGSPALSIGTLDDVWVYFGTGRFLGKFGDPDWTNSSTSWPDTSDTIPDFDDRKDTLQQYYYGLRDPFFNKAYDTNSDGIVDGGEYYHSLAIAKTLTMADLFNAATVRIGFAPATGQNMVFEAGSDIPFNDGSTPDYGPDGEWKTLTKYVLGEFDGWYHPLTAAGGSSPSERITSKPALLGGVSIASSYTPVDDPCQFGGTSGFYALYFETGTAYFQPILRNQIYGTLTYDNETYSIVAPKNTASMVGAPPPSVGIHVGREEGATAFVQQSTGEIIAIDVDPVFNIKSGLTYWRGN
ncbi:MAG: PilC/PilY family type IV pilus protein [Thermodesulfobacteriota bacterium]